MKMVAGYEKWMVWWEEVSLLKWSGWHWIDRSTILKRLPFDCSIATANTSTSRYQGPVKSFLSCPCPGTTLFYSLNRPLFAMHYNPSKQFSERLHSFDSVLPQSTHGEFRIVELVVPVVVASCNQPHFFLRPKEICVPTIEMWLHTHRIGCCIFLVWRIGHYFHCELPLMPAGRRHRDGCQHHLR